MPVQEDPHIKPRLPLLVAITVAILVERMPLYEKLVSLYNPS